MVGKHALRGLIIAAVTPFVLSACNGGGSSGSSTDGTFTLGITDAAIDGAQSVTVKFSGIEVHDKDTGVSYNFFYCAGTGGGQPTVATKACATPGNKSLDLTKLTKGVSALLLDGERLPAGDYDYVRLTVEDATLVDSKGASFPLTIPSGAESGLKLVSEFNVGADSSASFTIDFDLRKSVHVTGNVLNPTYLLRPALRIVNDLDVGKVTGVVSNALATAAGCTPAVYVYQGNNVTPDDLGSAAPPLTTADVTLDNASGNYTYTAAFLVAAQYTLAFTCQVGADDPSTDDNIAFTGQADVAVSANGTSVHDFN